MATPDFTPSGDSAGELWFDIRAREGTLAADTESAVQSAVAGAEKSASIPVRLDGSGLERQAEQLKGQFGETLKALGLTFGVAEGVNVLKEGTQAAIDLNTQIARSSSVFGDAGEGVRKFSDNSISAFGKTKGEGLLFLNDFGQIFTGFGEKGEQAAKDAEAITTAIAKLHQETGKPTDEVAGDVLSALKGRAAAMKELGIVIDDTSVKQKALALGLVSPVKDQDQINALQNQISAKRDELTALQKGNPNAGRDQEDAQRKVNRASAEYQQTLARYPANSLQAARAADALHSAEERLADIRAKGSGKGTAQDVKTVSDQIDALNHKLADAVQGTTPDLTVEQYGKAVNALIQDGTSGLPQYSNAFEAAGAGIRQAEEALGTGFLPTAQRFADYIQNHQGDIEHFGKTLGEDIGKAVGFIADHKDGILTIAKAFAEFKIAKGALSFVEDLKGLPARLSGLFGFADKKDPLGTLAARGSIENPMWVRWEGLPPGAGGGGVAPVAGTAASEEAALAGGGVASVVKRGGVLLPLTVVLGTDTAVQAITGGKAASLFSGDSYKNFGKGLTGDHGGGDIGEASKKFSSLLTAAQTPTWLGGIDPKDFYQTAKELLASPETLRDIQSGNWQSIAGVTKALQNAGLPASDPLVREWDTLAIAVQDNLVRTKDALGDFYTYYDTAAKTSSDIPSIVAGFKAKVQGIYAQIPDLEDVITRPTNVPDVSKFNADAALNGLGINPPVLPGTPGASLAGFGIPDISGTTATQQGLSLSLLNQSPALNSLPNLGQQQVGLLQQIASNPQPNVTNIGPVTVVNPTSDVDVVLAIRRAEQTALYRQRGIAPPPNWSPTLSGQAVANGYTGLRTI